MQFVVRLVGEDPNILLDRELRQLPNQIVLVTRTGRVVRVDQHQNPGPGRDGIGHRADSRSERLLRPGRHWYRDCTERGLKYQGDGSSTSSPGSTIAKRAAKQAWLAPAVTTISLSGSHSTPKRSDPYRARAERSPGSPGSGE